MQGLSVKFMLAVLLGVSGCVSPGGTARFAPVRDDTPPEARQYGDYMVARIASILNDPQTAADRFGKVVAAVPDPSAVAERAVFSALIAADYQQAVRLAERAADAGSEAGLIRLTRAVDALRRGDRHGARSLLHHPEFHPFNRGLARGLDAWLVLETEGLSAAEASLAGMLTGEPSADSPALYQLGLMQMSAGDDEAALETFGQVWSSGAKLALGAEAYAQILAARGEPDRASGLIGDFLDQVGANPALAALAERIRAGEKIEPSRLTARQGGALAIYVPAAALLYQTDDDLAGVYFTLVLALDPDLHVARPLLAQALVNADRPEDAMAVLRAVPESSPYYANARGQLAGILLQTGAGEGALEVAGEALRAHPDRGLRLQLADLYVTLENYDEAERVLADINRQDRADGRADWRVVFGLGAARERQGKWEAAEADLREAVALRPENPTLLNYLGYSWVDRGVNLQDGLQLIRRAVILSPRSGHFVDSLGWAYYRLGEFETAIDYLERAVELLPSDPILNDHLGDAYWQVGRRIEAVYQWRRALRLDPAEADRKRIEDKLGPGSISGAPGPAPGEDL